MNANKPIIHPDFSERVAFAESRAASRPEDWRDWSIAEARGVYAMAQPPTPDIMVGRVEEISIPGPDSTLRLRVYTPQGDGPFPVIMYMHGGGHAYGSLDTHDAPCRMLCQKTDCLVISVDYRLVPEHPLTACHEDCYSALLWISQNAHQLNGDTSRLAVAGDSAGGTLSANMTILSRDRAGPELCYQVLLVPGLDSDTTTDSYTTRANACLSPRMINYFLYLLSDENTVPDYRENRKVHPWLRLLHTESLAGLPPALVVVGECDLLYDCGVAYAERLQQSGVATELIIGEGMIHQFTSLAHLYPSARVYFDQIAERVRVQMYA